MPRYARSSAYRLASGTLASRASARQRRDHAAAIGVEVVARPSASQRLSAMSWTWPAAAIAADPPRSRGGSAAASRHRRRAPSTASAAPGNHRRDRRRVGAPWPRSPPRPREAGPGEASTAIVCYSSSSSSIRRSARRRTFGSAPERRSARAASSAAATDPRCSPCLLSMRRASLSTTLVTTPHRTCPSYGLL